MNARDDALTVRVLGAITVAVSGREVQLSPTERNLVALLAVAGVDGLSNDRIADEFWPDVMPPSWAASLRNAISRLNKKVRGDTDDGAALISDRSASRRLLLDPSQVDLWRLLTGAEEGALDDVSLLSQAPFPGCELSPLLRFGLDRIAAVRADILNHWVASVRSLAEAELSELRQLIRTDPFNQTLVSAVVLLHLVNNRKNLASELLDEVLAEFEAHRLTADDDLHELRLAIEAGARAGPANLGQPRVRPQVRAAAVARLTAEPIVGRSALLDELFTQVGNRSIGFVLDGRDGVGKTRLGAEIALRLEQSGHSTVYVAGDRRPSGTLQPLLAGFQGLKEIVQPYLGSLHLNDVRARCRLEILAYLEESFSGRPLCLLVDDAPWLDEESQSLLLALGRADLSLAMTIVVTGRTFASDPRWSMWISDLTRIGLTRATVPGLDQETIADMVTRRFPHRSRVEVVALAARGLRLSAGVPEVVNWWLGRLDQDRGADSVVDVAGTGYAAIVSTTDPETRHFGAVASLLGRQFNLAEAQRLAGVDAANAERLADQLIATGLVEGRPEPDEFQFLHILAAEAFGRALRSSEAADLHAEAFEMALDVRRRAFHAGRAGSRLAKDRAAATMVEAAHLHFADGNYLDAEARLLEAIDHHRATVGLTDELMGLEATERLGRRATQWRQQMVSEAVHAEDMSSALRAALTGLPGAEAFEGDIERVAVLQLIDAETLTADERIQLHLQLARQLVLVGNLEEARTTTELAVRDANTPDQKLAVWLGHRFLRGIGVAHDENVDWPELGDVTTPELRHRLGQARVISDIASGGSSDCYPSIIHHVDQMSRHGTPQLVWFAKMLQATALTDQGRAQDSFELTNDALQLGLRAGLKIASGAFETQGFVCKLHEQRHGDFHRRIEDGIASDLQGNLIYEASAISAKFAFGQAFDGAIADEARRQSLFVIEMARTSILDISAIGLLIDVLATLDNVEVRTWALERLATRADSYVLVASGAGNLGPSRGLMAMLVETVDQRLDLLRQAIEQADMDDLPLWQVIGRLRMAAQLPPDDPKVDEWIERAGGYATTPWLKRLHARRAERMRSQ
ncbi:MAG: hypothetical protein GY939_24940 [Actinomycetia bacterium]|nr:hypothetical protein [Actinomycetes bacterium]